MKTGALMFARLRSNVIYSISFVQKTFHRADGNGFVWRGRWRDWGTIATQI